MKTIFCTLLMLFSILATNIPATNFVPEQISNDAYGNRVVIQDSKSSYSDIVSNIETWAMTKQGKHFFPCLVIYQKDDGQARAEVVSKKIEDLKSVDVNPGNWTVKVFSFVAKGKQKKELASFSLKVDPGRNILVRVYFK